MIRINKPFEALFGSCNFCDFWRADGATVKQNSEGSRATVVLTRNGQTFFLKRHFGVGWGEIVKNLLSLKWPVVSARNEYHALRDLPQHGIRTARWAAYGWDGLSPATRRSFILMEGLAHVDSLENLAPGWLAGPSPIGVTARRALIRAVGRLARQLHDSGRVHQDFYICHMLAQGRQAVPVDSPAEIDLVLIDLHRAQRRCHCRRRPFVKDLAALAFSCMDLPLSQRDLFCFAKSYTGLDQRRDAIPKRRREWARVLTRATRLYERVHGKPPAEQPWPRVASASLGDKQA